MKMRSPIGMKRWSVAAWVLPGLLMVMAPVVGMGEVRAQGVETDRKAEADRLFQQGIEQFKVSQFREALES